MIDGARWLYHIFGQGAGAASIFVGLIALFGALGGALASWLVAGRSIYINSITAERSKWIEKLRSNLSAYYAALDTFTLQHEWLEQTTEKKPEARIHLTPAEMFAQLQRLSELASTLQLQLNPDGMIDGNIARIVASTSKSRFKKGKAIIAAERLLITHAQWLLKAEWEKVKFEARGPLYQLLHCNAEANRLKKYKKWPMVRAKLIPF